LDFGESKSLLTAKYTKPKGNWSKRAPEVENKQFSEEGDIWSLGVFALNLLSPNHSINYDYLEETQENLKADIDKVLFKHED